MKKVEYLSNSNIIICHHFRLQKNQYANDQNAKFQVSNWECSKHLVMSLWLHPLFLYSLWYWLFMEKKCASTCGSIKPGLKVQTAGYSVSIFPWTSNIKVPWCKRLSTCSTVQLHCACLDEARLLKLYWKHNSLSINSSTIGWVGASEFTSSKHSKGFNTLKETL